MVTTTITRVEDTRAKGIRKVLDNPETWVRRAFSDPKAVEVLVGDRPANIAESEWTILFAHVVEGRGYAEIGATMFRESGERIQAFAEDATRRLIPELAISAMASMIDPALAGASATEAASLMVYVGRLYDLVGTPFGNSPDGMARYFRALSVNEAAIDVLKRVHQDGGLVDPGDMRLSGGVTLGEHQDAPVDNNTGQPLARP